tara:strand:+ start:733 stop:1002 length:270 start_codon:yes stop_codon:yes gene_type:complete
MLIPWAHYEPQTIFKITMVSIMLDKLIILVHWLIFSLSLGLIGAGVQASFYKGGFYLIIVGLGLSIIYSFFIYCLKRKIVWFPWKYNRK